MKCTICKRDLPEDSFYPSSIKHYQYQCRECIRKQNNAYQKEVRESAYKDFDRFYGGYVISILNYPSPCRYTIKGTKGLLISTNDSNEFINKVKEIIEQYTE